MIVFETKQVVVACDKILGAARKRGRQHDIVIGVAANRTREISRIHELAQLGVSGQGGQGARTKFGFALEHAFQFRAQSSRPNELAHARRLIHHLLAKTLRGEGGEKHIGVEKDSHEMILKTSSSL